MISNQQNTALLAVGQAAMQNPAWESYAQYCFCREKGLRKEAFRHMDSFLQSARSWTEQQQTDFIRFLFPFFETLEEADYGPFPRTLSDRLVKPALEKWCSLEKTDGTPFRWYGIYYRDEAYLKKALDINPKDDIARQVIINRRLDGLYHAVHHLPETYLGDPDEDLRFAGKIKCRIAQLSVHEIKEKWTQELEKYTELIQNYRDWKSSGHQDFEEWGMKNGKQTGLENVASYYYKK